MTDHDDLRAAWAHVVRDHDMPPNKDQRGYDYRMGWWDAVIHLDRILTRGLRSCEDCPGANPPDPPSDVTEDEVAEVITRGAERVAQTVERARKVLDGWEHDGPDGYEFHLLIRRVREALELPLDHDFLPVQGHPDDDECTHREDGTDATYCGRTEAEHRDEHPAPEPPSDEAAMRIDPEPPGVTLRPFTDAEVAALDAEPPSGGEVTAEELLALLPKRTHPECAAAILARFDVRRRKPAHHGAALRGDDA